MRLWPRKQVYLDDLPRTHDLRFAAMFLLALVVLLGALYAVGFFVAGDRLPRGTTVAGIDVGGMRRAEARTELQAQLAPRLQRPISVRADGQRFTVAPQPAGLTFDIDATLSEGLAGDRWDPRHMLRVVMGGGPLDAVVDVDNQELEGVLGRMAAKVDREPVDATVVFEAGRPVVRPAVDGAAVEYDAARAALVGALLDGEEEATVPVASVPPAVTTAAAARFADRVARPAAAAPVRVTVADTTRSVPPAVFVPALRARPDGDRLRLAVDEEQLATRSQAILRSLPHHPVNARISFRSGHPVVVPGRAGAGVSASDWADAVLTAALKGGGARVATATVTPVQPAVTTADARQLGVRVRVAAAEVRVPAALVASTRTAAARLDGALLRPNTRFGLRSRLGGGPSPASTLVASAAYDAAMRAGMRDIARVAPRTPVPGATPGLDAQGPGLAWRNTTPYGVYIRAAVNPGPGDRGSLVVGLWSSRYGKVAVSTSARYDLTRPGTSRRQGAACRPRAGSPGFAIDTRRAIRAPDVGTRIEKVHTVYAPVDRVVCAR